MTYSRNIFVGFALFLSMSLTVAASDRMMKFTEYVADIEFVIDRCKVLPIIDQKKLAAIRAEWLKVASNTGHYDDGTSTSLKNYYAKNFKLNEMLYNENPDQTCRAMPEVIKNSDEMFSNPFVEKASP